MPFVTINVLEGKGKDYIKKVSDSVNEAVIETMAFPDDDSERMKEKEREWQRMTEDDRE